MKKMKTNSEFTFFDKSATKKVWHSVHKMIRKSKKILKIHFFQVPNQEEDQEFKDQISKAKQNYQLEHTLKVSEIMFHEQSQTEDLLKEALKQLKNLYLCTYTSINIEMAQSFKVGNSQQVLKREIKKIWNNRFCFCLISIKSYPKILYTLRAPL